MRSELYLLQGPWRGQLAILGRPRGNEWLGDEVKAWRNSGVHAVVSLLTEHENTELGLTEEDQISKREGLEFFSFPIRDYGVPVSIDSVLRLTQKIDKLLTLGKFVGIHCRQSVGRSGLIAACLLVAGGDSPTDAFLQLRKSRGLPVPDTNEQREWVFRFEESLKSQSDLLAAK